jgi:hypothetical protein
MFAGLWRRIMGVCHGTAGGSPQRQAQGTSRWSEGIHGREEAIARGRHGQLLWIKLNGVGIVPITKERVVVRGGWRDTFEDER